MESWSTSDLQYLTSEQALEDLAYFISVSNQEFQDDIGRIPNWIVIGGSYPGALAAWFKEKYPNYVVGAWTSSAVINPSLHFDVFDHTIYSITKKSGDLCPETIKSHYLYVEKAFEK